MANVHEVQISGEVPFNIASHEKARHWLGIMNGPSYGLSIVYGGESYIPNEHGGQTAMFEFWIEGREAIRTDSLLDIVKSFREAGGKITQAQAKDIENPGGWYSLLDLEVLSA